ncbi:MAG: hypothetical protein RL113_209 [Pseudomonadota bacterium]|jgi:lipoprotein-anchoring transpeptidase ErfK/SrfK
MTLKIIFIFSMLIFSILNAEEQPVPLPIIGTETIPLSKTVFKSLEKGGEKIVDLTGENFIVVSVREFGSDGRFYAVDRDGTVWWSSAITSGAEEYRTPSGIFTIFQKKRYHMSNLYPDENGTNNMDYMMKFKDDGTALHSGDVDWLSHGCIHIDPKDVPVIYNWSNYETKVVVTRHTYMPFAKEDLDLIYNGKGVLKN